MVIGPSNNSKLRNNVNKKPTINTNKTRMNEKFPNENLFKNDCKYKINKLLEFDSLNENLNYTNDIFRRKFPLVKYTIILLGIKYFFYFTIKSFILIILSYFQIILLSLSFYISYLIEKNLNSCSLIEVNKYLKYLRIIMEMNYLNHLFLNYYNNFSHNSLINLNFRVSLHHFVVSVYFNFLTNTTLVQRLIFYGLKGIVLIYICGGSFGMTLVSDLLVVLISIIFCLYIDYGVKRNFTELWGLYDSFKRSYFFLKRCLYDDFPNPIFIVSRKQYESIMYRNTAADKLHEKITSAKKKLKSQPNSNSANSNSNSNHNSSNQNIKKNLGSGLGQANKKLGSHRRTVGITGNSTMNSNNYSFGNLLEKEFEELFNKQIDKCINNKKKDFIFPFPLYENKVVSLDYKECSRDITFFDGDMECYEWYKVIVSPCVFKSQEAIMLQLLKDDIFYKDENISNFLSNLNNEFNRVVDNVDKICENIIEADFFFERKEKLRLLERLNINKDMNRNIVDRHLETKDQLENLRNGNKSKTLKNENNKTKIIKDLIIDMHNVKYPCLDHTIWFFFKDNLNMIYDSFLSMKIYQQLLLKKFLKPNTKISSFSSLVKYFDDNFFMMSQKNKINIISNLQYSAHSGNSSENYSIENEFYCVYEYIRIIIFNIYLFNLNNSTDYSKPRDMCIDYNLEKLNENEIKEYDFCLKINMYIEENSPIVRFDELAEVFNKIDLMNNPVNQNDFVNMVDQRILIIYMITKLCFHKEFTCKREENMHKISLTMLLHSKEFLKKEENCKNSLTISTTNKTMVNSSNSNLIVNVSNNTSKVNYFKYNLLDREIEEPKSYISEPYYVNLLNITYDIPIEYKPKYRNINLEYTDPSEVIEIISNQSSDNDDSNYNGYDQFVADEFQTNTLINDMKHTREYFMMNAHFDNIRFQKILNIESCEMKMKKVFEKSQELRILPLYKTISQVSQETWDYGSLKSSVNYFYPPRFLIVEDTVIGRFNLIDILKKQNLNCLIDVAAYGRESIQKFKFFLNKGFLYDIIFMDINLPDMLGSEATTTMRAYEKEYSFLKSVIIAVSVEGKNNVGTDDLFNDYFEKPIKPMKFTECIAKHFKINRPDLNLEKTRLT